MATVNYITPITDRTQDDVEYAKLHQNDLLNKNKGAWNYTDLNRICNNLQYAAEYMFEQGFLLEPYSIQVKLDWTETDIITYEQLNIMVIENMNNLYAYSRPDLEWYPIAAIVSMNYTLANWIEKNIHQLATQTPIEPESYTLTVNDGTGTGDYPARTIVTIQANPPQEGFRFDYWSGDHLENIEDPYSKITTYTMPYENVELTANYTTAIPHTLTIITYSGTTTANLLLGQSHQLEADPAPHSKVFHHWKIEPSNYEENLYEPAASTNFTMPDEDVTITAIYITPGKKHLIVTNGIGSGYYEYGSVIPIYSSKPGNGTFTSWTGDTQYLTANVEEEYNNVIIPDVNTIIVQANWTVPPTPPTPPASNIQLNVINGTIERRSKFGYI